MKRQRPALRVALLGIAAVVAAFAVVATSFGWRAHAYQAARQQATVVADGTVVEDGIGEYGDIQVRWSDRAGREHVQRFGVYDTDRYRRGAGFPVAYDPADPTPRGFPADPDETGAEDDLIVPIWIFGFTTLVIIFWWGLRGLRFHRAAGKPVRPMAATALSGVTANGPTVSFGLSTWIALATTGDIDSPDRWQRVMWHPILDTVRSRLDAQVHGDPFTDRRVVVETADGTRLVSIGRLRRRPPKWVILEEWADRRPTPADSFILPAGTPLLPAHRWWRRGMVLAFVGAVIGAAVGFLIWGGVGAVLYFTLGTSAVMVNIWALAGADP